MLFAGDMFKSDVIEEIRPKLGCSENKFKDRSQIQMEPKISTECFVSSLYIPVLRNEIILLSEPNDLSYCCCYERPREAAKTSSEAFSVKIYIHVFTALSITVQCLTELTF